jgi:hypothetical protein
MPSCWRIQTRQQDGIARGVLRHVGLRPGGAEIRPGRIGRRFNPTGYAVLLADSDGVVMETLAEPGQVVSAGQVAIRPLTT